MVCACYWSVPFGCGLLFAFAVFVDGVWCLCLIAGVGVCCVGCGF